MVTCGGRHLPTRSKPAPITLVVGRPIIRSDDPRGEAALVTHEIACAL